jgi:heptosyltransferase-2
MATSESVRFADERVLVIFPGALGDLICLIPTLRALSRRHRGAARELMAGEELARFAVERIGFEQSRIARGHSLARSHSIDRREVAALFAEDPGPADAAQLFRPFARIYSFFASDDARFRRGLQAAATPGAVSFHAFRPARDSHVAAAYLGEIGERAAAPDGTSDARLDVLPCDIDEARRALARLGLENRRVILLFPGSGAASKNWPAENFALLARLLAPPLEPLVVIGPAERSLEPLFITHGVATLREQPLGTVAGLAHIAAGFVGNDSGVSHLAAAAGAPGVAIFGPTDPKRWRPLGRVRVLQATRLADLTPAEVAAALGKMSATVDF